MSKTLFWYIFRDLFRIFFMAWGVLAGIMSFGGLLKPMMQYGLNGQQIGQMLTYFTPATLTYSLPIAALFATTMVYGRLSADNELTACRASGISHLSLMWPTVALGIAFTLISLLGLCFVVPRFLLKVEKVAFSSLADIVQRNIQRNHQLRLLGTPYTIFAESAEILPPLQGSSDERVLLTGPMFCVYERNADRVMVPTEFFSARTATVVIHQEEDHVEFSAALEEGVSFPREFKDATRGGVGTASFGPIVLQSPVKENVKFMDVRRLNEVRWDPLKSRNVRYYAGFIVRQEQELRYAQRILEQLRGPGEAEFVSGPRVMSLTVEKPGKPPTRLTSPLVLGSTSRDARQVLLSRISEAGTQDMDRANRISVRLRADPDKGVMRINFELTDVLLGASGTSLTREKFDRPFEVPLPPEIAAIAVRDPRELVKTTPIRSDEKQKLERLLKGLVGAVEGEWHGRVALALSNLILVLIGCALGMMFRTGNFLSAFALSVIPALVCIALIVTGQHVCENERIARGLGLGLIWSGNAIVLALAVGLLARLKRQ